MPLQNYKDLEHEFLENYWTQSKDILGVTHFGDLVPEVLYLGADYEESLVNLIDLRITYKLNKYRDGRPQEETKEKILQTKEILKTQMEKEIISRLQAVRRYLRSPSRDPHISLEEIFRQNKSRKLMGFKSLLNRVSGRKDRRPEPGP